MVNQTIHYMIASIVSAAMGLLSAIVFTRLLTPDEYGVYVIGLSTAGIVSAMLFTWVRVSALRFQSEGGSVDIRATIFLAYLLSVLASPVAFVIATLTTSVSVERNIAAVFFALGLGVFELSQEPLKGAAAPRASWCSDRSTGLAFCSAGRGLLRRRRADQLAMVTITYFITTLLFSVTIWRRPVAGLMSPISACEEIRYPITLSESFLRSMRR